MTSTLFGCYIILVSMTDTMNISGKSGVIKVTSDMVNNPGHYGGEDNNYEVIKVSEAWGLDKDAYLFNVVKYVARAGKKDKSKEIEDLKKAAFYLDRKIKNLEKWQ